MTQRSKVEEILAQRRLALAGASRRRGKFGNTVLKELRAKGYEVIPVHPEAAEIDGVPCVPSLRDLPEGTGGLVLVVPPERTEELVREAAAVGIPRVWMQQGAESPAAIATCEEHGLTFVAGECILMFAEPAGFVHRAHRWFKGVFGSLPR